MNDIDSRLCVETWNGALDILNDCDGNLHAAQLKVSQYVRNAPIPRRLKGILRKLLRMALYSQVSRDLRVPMTHKGESANG